jgi:hypothetical protein
MPRMPHSFAQDARESEKLLIVLMFVYGLRTQTFIQGWKKLMNMQETLKPFFRPSIRGCQFGDIVSFVVDSQCLNSGLLQQLDPGKIVNLRNYTSVISCTFV